MSRKTTPTYVLLNQITLAATTSSVTLSNIPQNFNDLVLVWDGLLTSSGTYNLRINSTLSGYSSVWAAANSNNNAVETSTGAANSATDRIPCVIYTGTPTSGRVSGVWEFADYSSTNKNKNLLFKGSGTHEAIMVAGGVETLAAISSITVYTPQSFAINSNFYLYGII
jgi:hypothetical protein